MTYNGLPAIHPGEYLAEILEALSVSQAEFARVNWCFFHAHITCHQRNTPGDGRIGVAVWPRL